MVPQVGRGRRAHQAWQQASVPAFVLAARGWASADVRAWARSTSGLALQGFCRGVFLQNSAWRWWSPDLAEMRPGWVW